MTIRISKTAQHRTKAPPWKSLFVIFVVVFLSIYSIFSGKKSISLVKKDVSASQTKKFTTNQAENRSIPAPVDIVINRNSGYGPLNVSQSTYVPVPTNQSEKRSIPAPVDIAINRNSSYVLSDVSKIIHIPSEARIEIHLQPNATRRCQNPYFIGRISGWSLCMIQFDDTFSDVVSGTYDIDQMPISGSYYVEIILVLCETFQEDAFRTMDLRKVHLEIEKDSSHQITEGFGMATINVTLPNEYPRNHAASFRGRWVHKSLLSHVGYPRPAYTPFQPLECKHGGTEYCDGIGPLRKAVFKEYTFNWTSSRDTVLNQPGLGKLLVQQKHQHLLGEISTANATESKSTENGTHVCFLGSSHSRVLNEGCNELLSTTREIARSQNLEMPLLDGFQCSQIKVEFPTPYKGEGRYSHATHEAVMNSIDAMGCTHVVVGLFQWFFSRLLNRGHNMTFGEWKSSMKKAVELLRNTRQSTVRGLILRSAHPNGFGFRYIDPIASEFRTPVNAKFATKIIQEIVDELESTNSNETAIPLSFMDTSFIIDPVWDSAQDWSHYGGEVRSTEANFVLSEILKSDELLFQGSGSGR